MFYHQCKLIKNNTEQIAFIPVEFAFKGRKLKIKENDEWSSGWIVEYVSQNKVDEKNLPDSHKQIKAHRNQTGDSQAKDKIKRESTT